MSDRIDPFLWLEEVEDERALAWVRARNEATLAALSAHPAYDSIHAQALAILTSRHRLAVPEILGDRIYNFWQDGDHERGIWRRTSWASYLTGAPEWETVLDVDALAAAEGIPWAWGGATCLPPEHRLCMVRLSRGGADAVEIREFDLEAKAFVEGGFRLPEAKAEVAWRGLDELLVATAFGERAATTSGYARHARLWRRGTPLAEARVLLEAAPADVAVGVGSVETPAGAVHLVTHMPGFFDFVTHVVGDDGELIAWDVPLDCGRTLTGPHLALQLRSPWSPAEREFATGSVIAIPYHAFLAGSREFELVLEPGPGATVESVRASHGRLLIETLENVKGRLWLYRCEDSRWIGERVEAPDMGSVIVLDADARDPRFFFTWAGFTRPTTLYMGDSTGRVREVRRMPEMFDAAGLEVRQLEATSKDGTRVPYFLVGSVDPEGGPRPTLLNGYGGFQVSRTPAYDPIVGRGWLERGGLFAVANIRGGGEFGPDWWRAAQRENRQLAYDDFIAVAEDLIARGFTRPGQLGIHGGSNGGLLVGVAMTQRPELFDAVVVEVPLLDMLRYHRMLAGASWMDEFGDPDVPEERAWLEAYSPYQKLDPAADYPVPFIYTTTRDDRVHPGHARKMAARMLEQGHEAFYYENMEGGHGRAITPEQRAQVYGMMYAYLWERLAERGGRG